MIRLTFPNIEDVKDIERMLKLHPDKYFRCDECGGIWMRGQSKEDMKKEYKENFPYDPEMKIPRGIICEDCYQELYKQTEGFTKKPSFNYYEQWSIGNEQSKES